MSILDEVCSGIRTKSVLGLLYDGQRRVVHPYIVWTDKKGDTMVECWQTAGFSSRGTIPCWSRYSVDKITRVEETGEHFQDPQPGFNPERQGAVICSI